MPIRELDEQTGAFQLLLILFKEGALSKVEVVKALKRSATTAYSALRTLKKMGLITEVEPDSFPFRKDVSLTEKGRRVAEHLVEVERILSEK